VLNEIDERRRCAEHDHRRRLENNCSHRGEQRTESIAHRRWNLAAKRSRRPRKIFKTRISTTSSEHDPLAQMIVVAAAAADLPRRGSREWNSSLIAPRLDLSM